MVRYRYDSELLSHEVKVASATGGASHSVPMAEAGNPLHVAAPSNGDLWVVHVKPGDLVKAGQELFNISIMKQEKAVLATVDGIVKNVFKTADYKTTRKMVPVREGELIVELGRAPNFCANPACAKPLPSASILYCPWCGHKVSD